MTTPTGAMIVEALGRHPVLLSIEPCTDPRYLANNLGYTYSLFINYDTLGPLLTDRMRQCIKHLENVDDVGDMTGIDRWTLTDEMVWGVTLRDPATWLPQDGDEFECDWSVYYGAFTASMTLAHACELCTSYEHAQPHLIIGSTDAEVVYADAKGRKIFECASWGHGVDNDRDLSD